MSKKPWFFGKNILITGASSGIGFYIANKLASLYACNVIGVARSEEKLIVAKEKIDNEILASGELVKKKYYKKGESEKKGSFNFFACDIGDNQSVQNLKAKIKESGFSVQLLINNAGMILPFDRLQNQEIDMIDKLLRTNLYSQIFMYKAFIEDIQAEHGGVVNISSSSALCPVVGSAVYGASKAGVKSLTEVLMLEHKDLYIAYMCPGFTKTELFRGQHVSSVVSKLSTSVNKIGDRIIKKIAKKKRRVVVGYDAHLMSGFYKLMPRTTLKAMTAVLKKSNDPMFDNVFKK